MGLLSRPDLYYGTKVPTRQSKCFGMPNFNSEKILDRMMALKEERSLSDYCQTIGLNYVNIRK